MLVVTEKAGLSILKSLPNMGLCFHSTAGISIPCFWMFRKFRNLNGISLSFGQLHEQTLWANDKAGDQWAPDTTHSPRANSPVPHFHSFLPLSCPCHRGLYWHTFSTAWLHLPTSANALLSPVLPWACYLPDFCHAPMPVFSPCLFFLWCLLYLCMSCLSCCFVLSP